MPCKAQHRRTCQQGRQPCPTPYVCSGVSACSMKPEVESVDTTESTKGLLTSRTFWLLGLACVLIWSGLWELCVAWLRHH